MKLDRWSSLDCRLFTNMLFPSTDGCVHRGQCPRLGWKPKFSITGNQVNAIHRSIDSSMSRDPETTLIASHTSSIEIIDRYLEDCLERLLPNCPVTSLADLRDYLPIHVSETHRRLLLCEMIKLDMAIAYENGDVRVIDDYVRCLRPPLSLDTVPLDLVLEERQILGGDPAFVVPPTSDRFPHLAASDAGVPNAVQKVQSQARLGKPPELTTGEVVDDFRLVRELGRGAFAHVYLAHQESMQRLVALKVSHGTGGESQTLARLDHPNIVRVFDQRESSDPACHLLYMQYVPGGTLADSVKSIRKRVEDGAARHELSGQALLASVDENLLDAQQIVPERSPIRDWLMQASWSSVVAWVGLQLARSLDTAHEQGVLHRDVKPANVLLSSEGIPKLADFNVSFAEELSDTGGASNFGGSVAYMSPEHLRAVDPADAVDADQVDSRSDLYSLGVLLWELWQGGRPFRVPRESASWTEVLHQQSESRCADLVPPIRTGDASEGVLESALRRTLMSDPSLRPSRGNELAAKLQLALHPEVAEIFDPPASSWKSRCLAWSPRLVAAVVILTPNFCAGVFNYFYNRIQIIDEYQKIDQSFESVFKTIALVVNLIAFPAGAAMMLYFTQPIVEAMKRVRRGETVPLSDLDHVIELPRNAAVIGGLLWVIAGAIYPISLMTAFPSFDRTEAIHFYMSLLVCGGVAAVYPFFGMMLLVTKVYYVRFQRDQLRDPEFDRRSVSIRRLCSFFLIAAAVIPLVGLTLLLSRDVTAKAVMLTAVIASVVGLTAAFVAYDKIVTDWRKMTIALGKRSGPILPGDLG